MRKKQQEERWLQGVEFRANNESVIKFCDRPHILDRATNKADIAWNLSVDQFLAAT